MVKVVKWILLILTLTTILAGCGKQASAPVKKKTVPVTQKAPAPKKETPHYYYPLTGLPIDHPSTQRVVGVMINNYYLARPQSGLDQADIVYEVLAEGQITRFLALFQSHQPSFIGPVRSARPYFIKLSQGYHSLYVCHGWSPTAKIMLERGDADSLNGLFYDGTLFHRVTFRQAPHNSYISFKNIEKGAKMKGYKMTDTIPPLPFDISGNPDTPGAKPVKSVKIYYASDNVPGYTYDSQKQLFVRTINGVVAKDRESKKALVANNVMILEAKHRFIDSYGRREIDIESGGKGYLLQKGKILSIQWKNVNGRLLPYKNGKQLSFIPGKTWINIVPDNPGLDHYVTISNK